MAGFDQLLDLALHPIENGGAGNAAHQRANTSDIAGVVRPKNVGSVR
jgi:hypothetical protein